LPPAVDRRVSQAMMSVDMPAREVMTGRVRVIRILIADDTRLFRETLAATLAYQPSLDLIAEAVCLAECCARIDTFRPNIVLLQTAADDSIAILQTIARVAPEVRVLALGVNDTEEEVIELAEAGAAGYLLRDGSLADLIATIVSVTAGETLCSPRVAAALLRRVAALAAESQSANVRAHLTAREQEIIQLVDQGFSNTEIAQRLVINVRTVKNHVHNILDKLQVRRRSEAAARMRYLRPAAQGAARF
jgi:two-component system, NarL family, nitrate/nitrite response regulator NarL